MVVKPTVGQDVHVVHMHQKFVLFVGLFVIVAVTLIQSITTTKGCTSSNRPSSWGNDGKKHKNKHYSSFQPSNKILIKKYEPSMVEKYVMDNAEGKLSYLNLTGHDGNTTAYGCGIWTDPTSTPYYKQLRQFTTELRTYNTFVSKFKRNSPYDLRRDIREQGNHDVCDTLEVVKGGPLQIFQSGVLSRVGNDGGYVEPLLPPLRHPDLCLNKALYVMDMRYIIQDFASLCRKLKPHSRVVFVDMGAALDFHAGGKDNIMPAVYITQMYQKFGFHFDHIYAFELKQKDPADVYRRIPEDLRAAYHWFNVGVDSDPDSPNNPFNILLKNFDEDDFIVVKLGKKLGMANRERSIEQ